MTSYTELHEIQNSILKKLSYSGKKSFSDLQGDTESNKLAFHLKKLRKKNFIDKDGDLYYLSKEGKEILPYVGLSNSRHPITVVNLTIYSGDKVFLNRKKDPLDPFSGDYRVLTSRIGRGQRIEETVRQLYNEKFGEEPENLSRAGVFDSMVEFENGSSQHYILFYFKATKEEVTEEFYSLEDLNDIDLIPGLETTIKKIRDDSNLPFLGTWDLSEVEKGFNVDELKFQ